MDQLSFITTAADQLGKVIPFDGACWHTVDPASLLITSHHTNLSGEGFRFICRNEYLQEDVNKFSTLAGRLRPVGILSDGTGGHLELSTRYREVYQSRGWGSEMRASIDGGGVSWGSVMLLREAGRPDFTSLEAEFLASLGRHLAHGLRTSLLLPAAEASDDTEGPGRIVLDAHDSIEAMTRAAERWIAELGASEQPDATAPPAPVLAIAAQTRALVRRDGNSGPASVRVRTPSGRWLRMHGLALSDPPDGRVAILVEVSSRLEIAPLIVQAYGLTAREREVAGAALRGQSNREIAAGLRLSPHTVHDQLKSIYEKTSAHGRQDLVGRVFYDQFEPRLQRRDHIGADGWFVDRPRQEQPTT
ncbi:MAG: helix-turn-helix transcriptional regulator [Candidatus Dormibacteria bacterium]